VSSGSAIGAIVHFYLFFRKLVYDPVEFRLGMVVRVFGRLLLTWLAVLWACMTMAGDMGFLSGVTFQTETVSRGRREGALAVLPEFELGTNRNEGCDIYLGTRARFGTKATTNYWDSVSPYVGITDSIGDFFIVDAGYVCHFYPQLPRDYAGGTNSSEFYAGVICDGVLFEPQVYASYHVRRMEFAVEGKIIHRLFDFPNFFSGGLGIDVGANVGFDRASRPYALRYDDTMGSKQYVYYGAGADLTYTFGDCAFAKAGVRYAGNGGKKNAWQNNYRLTTAAANNGTKNAPQHMVWFSASVDCEF
jgi:hypothetical protein